MAYQGQFYPKNPLKYDGNPGEIYYRSSWELSVMFWCDSKPFIQEWASETVVIPYLSPIDRKAHRYFIDFKIVMRGEIYLIEVKPAKQVSKPKKPKKVTKRFITEAHTYIVNTAKWEAAKRYADNNNCKFQIWTENTLRGLGIEIIGKFNK